MDYPDNSTDPEVYVDGVVEKYGGRFLAAKIAIDILSFVTILCVICDLMACFIILKFRRLRQNASCQILVNWFQLNFIFMLTSPLLESTVVYRLLFEVMSFESVYIFFNVHIIAFFGMLFSIILLTFQWYLNFYHPQLSTKYERICIRFICGLDTILMIYFIYVIFSIERSLEAHIINLLFLVGSYILYNLFMIIIYITHCFRKKAFDSPNYNVAYIVTTVFFFLNLSTIIVFLMYWFSVAGIYFFIILCIFSLFSLSCPFYFFLTMYKHDIYFNTFTKHIVTCRCRKYTGDEFCDQSVHYSRENV